MTTPITVTFLNYPSSGSKVVAQLTHNPKIEVWGEVVIGRQQDMRQQLWRMKILPTCSKSGTFG